MGGFIASFYKAWTNLFSNHGVNCVVNYGNDIGDDDIVDGDGCANVVASDNDAANDDDNDWCYCCRWWSWRQ